MVLQFARRPRLIETLGSGLSRAMLGTKCVTCCNKMLLFRVEDFNFYASVDHLIEQPTASKKCYPSGSVEMLMFYSYPLGNKDSCSQILITMHECIRGGGLPLNIICHSHATIPQVIGLQVRGPGLNSRNKSAVLQLFPFIAPPRRRGSGDFQTKVINSDDSDFILSCSGEMTNMAFPTCVLRSLLYFFT